MGVGVRDNLADCGQCVPGHLPAEPIPRPAGPRLKFKIKIKEMYVCVRACVRECIGH